MLIKSNLVLAVHMYCHRCRYHDFLISTVTAKDILQKVVMFYRFSVWCVYMKGRTHQFFNTRKLFQANFQLCGVASENFNQISLLEAHY